MKDEFYCVVGSDERGMYEKNPLGKLKQKNILTTMQYIKLYNIKHHHYFGNSNLISTHVHSLI